MTPEKLQAFALFIKARHKFIAMMKVMVKVLHNPAVFLSAQLANVKMVVIMKMLMAIYAHKIHLISAIIV